MAEGLDNEVDIPFDDGLTQVELPEQEPMDDIQTDQLNDDRDDINQLKIPFDKAYAEVVTTLQKCRECIADTERLHVAAVQKAETLEENINPSDEQKEWRDIEVKLGKTLPSKKIILNVGGCRYTTSIDTLTRENDTFFTDIFSREWRDELDSHSQSLFIDRNGAIFTYILEYLRTGMVADDVINIEENLESLMIEARYYRLLNLINFLTEAERTIGERQRTDGTFPDSTLLKIEHKKKLNEFFGKPNQQWRLSYKASRDGFDANAFHTRCNNQGPTMTIIQSTNNYLFFLFPNINTYLYRITRVDRFTNGSVVFTFVTDENEAILNEIQNTSAVWTSAGGSYMNEIQNRIIVTCFSSHLLFSISFNQN